MTATSDRRQARLLENRERKVRVGRSLAMNERKITSAATLGAILLAAAPAPAQARLLRDIHPTGSASPSGFCQSGPSVFFSANDAQGRHLYKLTGTRITRLGTAARSPRDIVTFGGGVLFSASTPTSGRELWISDGTVAGTRMLRDIFRGELSSEPSHLTAVGRKVYFAANDGVRGTELWVTGGTFASTALVSDIARGRSSSFPEQLCILGTKVVFSATRPDVGREPFVSDGTDAGTKLLSNIASGTRSSNPSHMRTLQNHVYFGATNASGKPAYFRTNGRNFTTETSAHEPTAPLFETGTQGLLPMRIPGEGEGLFLQPATFLSAPKLVTKIGLEASEAPRDFVATSGGTIFFSVAHPKSGRELHVTNLTDRGTRMVRDVRVGPRSGFAFPIPGLSRMVAVDSRRVVFAGFDANGDGELWISDGSAAGTYKAQDINPTGSANPQEFLRYGGNILFVATDGVRGFELYTLRPDDITGGSATAFGNGCRGTGVRHSGCIARNTDLTPRSNIKHDTVYAIEVPGPTSDTIVAGYEILTARLANATTGTMRGSLMLPRLRGDAPFATVASGDVVLDPRARFQRIVFDRPAVIPRSVKFFLTVDATEAIVPIAAKGTLSRRFVRKKNETTWMAAGPAPFVFRVLCQGTQPTAPLHGAAKPSIGGHYVARLQRAAPRTAALLQLGFSDRKLGPFDLPLDLRLIGAPGCSLLTSAELAIPLATDGIGDRNFTIRIPGDGTLTGLRLFSQFAILDPRANVAGVALSNGVRYVIGR